MLVRRMLLIASLTGPGVAGCGSFEGTEAPADAGAGADSAPPDAGAPALLRADFEEETPDCKGWTGSTAVAKRVAAGPLGSGFACQVCSTGTAGSFFHLEATIGPAVAGSRYSIEASVVLESGSATTRLAAAFVVDGKYTPGTGVFANKPEKVTQIVMPTPGQNLVAQVSGRNPMGAVEPACFLVDGIVVTRLP
jgi:hypothetical protein